MQPPTSSVTQQVGYRQICTSSSALRGSAPGQSPLHAHIHAIDTATVNGGGRVSRAAVVGRYPPELCKEVAAGVLIAFHRSAWQVSAAADQTCTQFRRGPACRSQRGQGDHKPRGGQFVPLQTGNNLATSRLVRRTTLKIIHPALAATAVRTRTFPC